MVWLRFDVECVDDGTTMTFPFALGIVTFLTVKDGDAGLGIPGMLDLPTSACSFAGIDRLAMFALFPFDRITTGVASSSTTGRPAASLTGSATLLRRLCFDFKRDAT